MTQEFGEPALTTNSNLPASIDEVQDILRRQVYVTDRALAVPIFLALKLQRPLFLEGEAGVGKTEIARALHRFFLSHFVAPDS